MRSITRLCLFLILVVSSNGFASADEATGEAGRFRILSWNVSDDAFVSHPLAFKALLRRAAPDTLILDEVAPAADAGRLQNVLGDLRAGDQKAWQIDFGKSGGRQRVAIASRAPLAALTEFSAIVAYPDADKRFISQAMSLSDRLNPSWPMDKGIPVNGAVVLFNNHRLLVVGADLQCCGADASSWQEYRRRVEAREIRKLVRQVLAGMSVNESFILDTEDLSPEALKRDGLEKKTSSMLSDHRPLIVEYVWH